jgi:hypothetical protein
MCCIQAHHPTQFTIDQLDKELAVMGIICVLSEDAFCCILVSQCLHTNEIKLDTIKNNLVTEDIHRASNLTLYGLESTPESGLSIQGLLSVHPLSSNTSSTPSSKSGCKNKPKDKGKMLKHKLN